METSADLLSIDPKQRIHVLDALRGFALLGILLMNIPYFGMPQEVVTNLNIRNEFGGANYYTWWIIGFFFEGSMRGLFSLMFGASMVLLTERLSAKSTIDSAADIYYRRLLWMLLFGFFDAFIIMWPGDILYSYAICGLFLFPFRRMKPQYLFLIAGLVLLLFTAQKTHHMHEPLRMRQEASVVLKIDTLKTKRNDDQKEVLQKWTGFQEKQKLANKKKEVEKEIKKIRGPFGKFYGYYTELNVMLQSTEFYENTFLDCLLFMLIGIAFYKLKILTGERTMQFYLMLAIAGYCIALPLVYWQMHLNVSNKFDLIKTLEKMPVATYQIRRLGLTLGHLGTAMFFYKLGIFRFIFNVWAKVGQMAFSNYLLQNITCAFIFYSFGLGYYNELQRYQLYFVVAGVWCLNVAFSYIWLRFFRMGPFEWIWRSLTYWNLQPMKR